MSTARKSVFIVKGHVEVLHDKGLDLVLLKKCVEKSFLLLPTTISGKTENPVYSKMTGELLIKRISVEDAKKTLPKKDVSNIGNTKPSKKADKPKKKIKKKKK